MNPSLATLVYVVGIFGLFYLNRDKSVQTSKALWIPVIWFWILGSRAVSIWMGAPFNPTAGGLMEGSPIDAFVFQVLLVSGLVVLFTGSRATRAVSVMTNNWPIILYFCYGLVSVIWSDYPDVSLKRWIKATGDIVMALIVVTDAQPVVALRRVFSRVGFILLPLSLLLIKYYPYLGRKYNAWTGEQSITGVTTDKNLLGVATYVLTLGALWQVIRLWRESSLPNRTRQLVAQCAILGFGLWILFTANSATSLSCFLLATFIMLVTRLRRLKGRPSAVHAMVLTLALIGVVAEVSGAHAAVLKALGRNPNLTGRASEIWPMLIPMAPNFLVGAGFESFWLGPRLLKVWAAIPNLYVTEAHNGYLEVYLNLGAIGVILVLLVMIHGYRRSVATCKFDPDSGSLTLAYVLSVAMYSYTEAGFRMLELSWCFLLLAVIAAIPRPAAAAHTTSLGTEWRRTQQDEPETVKWAV